MPSPPRKPSLPPEASIEVMREVMAWMKAQDRHVPVIVGASTAFGCSIDGVVTTAPSPV